MCISVPGGTKTSDTRATQAAGARAERAVLRCAADRDERRAPDPRAARGRGDAREHCGRTAHAEGAAGALGRGARRWSGRRDWSAAAALAARRRARHRLGRTRPRRPPAVAAHLQRRAPGRVLLRRSRPGPRRLLDCACRPQPERTECQRHAGRGLLRLRC